MRTIPYYTDWYNTYLYYTSQYNTVGTMPAHLTARDQKTIKSPAPKKSVKRTTTTKQNTTPRWQRRPEDRTAELLAVALRCFSEDGIDAVSLEEIARQAGVTKGTFYHYFSSKGHLLEEIMASYAAPRAKSLVDIAQSDAHPRKRLEQLLRAHWSLLTTTPMRYLPRLLLTAAPRHPELTKQAMRHGIAAVKGAYQRCIDDGIANGAFRRIGGTAIVELCIMPMLTRTMMAGTTLEKAMTPATQFIDAHCDVILSALQKAPQEQL